MNIRIIEPAEIAAVKAGEIDGTVFKDGEVWANEDALRYWRVRNSKPTETKETP
jgi:hypothetical protein